MYRAILNNENVCVGICTDAPLYKGGILVNRDVTGMKYENGKWCEVEQSEPEPTELEQLRADLDYMAIMTGIEL